MRAVRKVFCWSLLLGLGPMRLLAFDLDALPQKTGQVFMVDDFDFKITESDKGLNCFSGNGGAVNQPAPGAGVDPNAILSIATHSYGTTGGCMQLVFNFAGQGEAFGGAFMSLFGLTDTKVELTGSGLEPASSTTFSNYFANFNNLYGAWLPMSNRSIDRVAFEARLAAGSSGVVMKVELSDEAGFDIFGRVALTSTVWQTYELVRADFNQSVQGNNNTAPFDWSRVNILSLLVEHTNSADHISNPETATVLIDNVRLLDRDGLYPNLDAVTNIGGGLNPGFARPFLDYMRGLSFLYFLDFASTDIRTGGIIQDRGSFADLMTAGGVGFQLTAYVVGAERGYIARTVSVQRVKSILDVLWNHPQGTNRVGTIGYKGFFYHFLDIAGLRKQNFDVGATVDLDESKNTVELSVIDTALALAGVITARQYFTGDDPDEQQIRTWADAIVGRVEWPFMLCSLPGGSNQFYLGWKPNEVRDDEGSWGRFKLPDAQSNGCYSSKLVDGVEKPATLDYYTDEGLLILVLAMSSPVASNRIDRAVWDGMTREGTSFVKTYPGSLFTYQFLSVWMDTRIMDADNHAVWPVSFFENTREAIAAARNYASSNAASGSGLGSNAWGFSAAEGPFDAYYAESAPPLAIAQSGEGQQELYEAENAAGSGINIYRDKASGFYTRRFETITPTNEIILTFDLAGTNQLALALRYSNDGGSDALKVMLDGAMEVGTWVTTDTRLPGGTAGSGWNEFQWTSALMVTGRLASGTHTVSVQQASGDFYGVDLDAIRITGQRPADSGTLTVYALGSAIVHEPEWGLQALWHAARLDLNGDGKPDLLHPRFGFADAYNVDISHARAGLLSINGLLRTQGAWLNPVGFAIDQGPMMVLLDNYLNEQQIPRLFMAYPPLTNALPALFTNPPVFYTSAEASNTLRMKWTGVRNSSLEMTPRLLAPDWTPVISNKMTNAYAMPMGTTNQAYFRVRAHK